MSVTLEKIHQNGNYSETYKINISDDVKVENKRLRHKRGVIVFLRELFEEANIKFEAYWSSIKFFVRGEEHIIFQHTSKSGIEWFHFSDLFKGRSIKPFLRRVKKFLVEKIGAYIKEIFDRFMKKLDKYLGHLVDDAKKEGEKARVPVEKKLIMCSDGTIILKYWGLIKIALKNGSSRININVAKEFFEENRELYMKAITDFLNEAQHLLSNFSASKKVVIKKQKAWIIG